MYFFREEDCFSLYDKYVYGNVPLKGSMESPISGAGALFYLNSSLDAPDREREAPSLSSSSLASFYDSREHRWKIFEKPEGSAQLARHRSTDSALLIKARFLHGEHAMLAGLDPGAG